MKEDMTPRLEKDTYIEGDETLPSEELTRVLEAAIQNIEACRAGGERRVTVVTDDGTYDAGRISQKSLAEDAVPETTDGL